MSLSLRRRFGFAFLLSLMTGSLVLGFAWPGTSAPWIAATSRDLPLAEFESPASQVSLTQATVRAVGADAQGATQLMQSVAALNASDYRYFSFDVDGSTSVSKRVLMWRGSEGQGVVALPDTPLGRGSVDLSRVPGWKGTIDSIGVIALPTDYLPAAAITEASLELRAARLESVSWRGALATLWSEWSSYRPWMGRSSNTGGLELGTGAGASLQAFLAAWLASVLIAVALCFGIVRVRRLSLPLLVFGCALLALWQIRQLGARAAVASDAAALVNDHQPPLFLAAQPQLAAAAHALSEHLQADVEQADVEQADDEHARLLVHGSSQFLGEYSTWLLRTQEVAMIWAPDQLPAQEALTDWLLVLVGQGDWQYSAESGRLRLGPHERAAAIYFDAGVMKAYRFDIKHLTDSGATP